MKSWFRVRYGAEKGWLIKSLDWHTILDVRCNALYLRVNSRYSLKVAGYVFGVPSLIVSFFATFILVRLLSEYLVTIIPQAWLRAWLWLYVGGILLVFFGGFILAVFGFIFLAVFLTFPVLARFSTPAAILNIKEIRMRRLRHIIKVSVEKELFPLNLQEKNLVLTVSATRRGLKNALRQFVIETPAS